MPQFWCFAISVQCIVQFPHFVFFQSCISYQSSGSGGSANKSWSTSARKDAVCTSIETVMRFDSGSLFLSCELATSIVFRDNVDGVGENISGYVRP